MTATDPTEHDVIGIGLGPFNLGLAALLDGVPNLRATCFEARPAFSWHPGMLLDGASLQVPFLADLVTLADPTSRHSFLNYLHTHDRLYRFYFYEHTHVPRKEFDRYCRWVATNLADTCRFGHRVLDVSPVGTGWSVKVGGPDGAVTEHRAASVVAGVGSRPSVPACTADLLGPDVLHSAGYVPGRDRARAVLGNGGRVTVVGSGQSAAEIFADLLDALPPVDPTAPTRPPALAWVTASRGFFPMEYSKLGLEHFTPEYTRWFHGLPEPTRDELRGRQDLLYKGISAETSAAIYDALYERTVDQPDPGVTYAAGFELHRLDPPADAGAGHRLHLRHVDAGTEVIHHSDMVILATGYEPTPLPLADPAVLARDRQGRPEITLDYRVRLADGRPSSLFVQNGELHTHGVGAPDLGLGARRNATIVNALAGAEIYRVPDRTVFQSFGSLG